MSKGRNDETPGPSSEHTDTSAISPIDSTDSLADVTDLTEEEREVIAALPRDSALLIIRRGPDLGARYLLDQEVTTAGRHPDCEIFLDDVTVSRRHAEFRRTSTGFEVVDLGSLNGTYVGGHLVDRAVLADGLEVMVGKFRLTFFASRLVSGA